MNIADRRIVGTLWTPKRDHSHAPAKVVSVTGGVVEYRFTTGYDEYCLPEKDFLTMFEPRGEK